MERNVNDFNSPVKCISYEFAKFSSLPNNVNFTMRSNIDSLQGPVGSTEILKARAIHRSSPFYFLRQLFSSSCLYDSSINRGRIMMLQKTAFELTYSYYDIDRCIMIHTSMILHT